MAFGDPTQLRQTTWKPTFNGVFLGFVDKTTLKLPLITKAIECGTTGKGIPLGERVRGMQPIVTVEFRECNLTLFQDLFPWWSTGAISSPAVGADLYTYAKLLTLHPVDMASATTEDVNIVKAVPGELYQPERDGEADDVLAVDFKAFPDRAALPALNYVYIGTTKPW